ncbi:hypothetical protein QJS04_geneDACA020311 [Acorus gramineus]|uniref:Uncharacterized protein n=1 Tax=Acorus gramineus TaxID=55184 RepID=A0AAV9A840_ACOGR|nr:hypothetical protein QJS04_geneDACA020311 [Acorus gramineus]
MAEVQEFKLKVAYPVALFSASCLVYPPEETLSSTTVQIYCQFVFCVSFLINTILLLLSSLDPPGLPIPMFIWLNGLAPLVKLLPYVIGVVVIPEFIGD